MPVIQTERLVLRPLTTNDFSAFRQFAADAELTRYMLFYPQETESETKAFSMQNRLGRNNAQKRMSLLFCKKIH